MHDMHTAQLIVDRIRELREAKGIGQKEMATVLGRDPSTYSRKEKGSIPIQLNEVDAILDKIGATWGNLVGDIEPSPEPLSQEEQELLRLFRDLKEKNHARAQGVLDYIEFNINRGTREEDRKRQIG